MTKIVFDLEEFKRFLGELVETEYHHGCRSPIDSAVVSYYFNEIDGRIKAKRKCNMNDGSTEIDDDYYDDMTIKGKIINEDRVLLDICKRLDVLYYYATELIGKETIHNLGFKKEQLKEFIEQKIKSL